MLVFLCVCFITAFICCAHGQGNITEMCRGIIDFDHCRGNWMCDLNVSQCFCKSQTPYCRCNNYIDEFYLGKSCSQKWSTLSFALVATLPGVALALVIGAAVHLAHRFGKSSKSHRAGNELTVIPEQNFFSGVVFASDLNAPPRPGPVPVPMVSSQLYSLPDNTQSGALIMGTPQPQYSAPDTQPTFDRPPLGPSYSVSLHSPSPVMSVPGQQPYSYMQGGAQAQTLSNLYAKTRNPYEERSVSPEPHHQAPSPQPYDDQRMAPPPALFYSASEYRSVLPRAQFSRPY